MKRIGHILLRGSAARLAANGVGMAVSFLLMPMLLRELGDRNFGIWALVGAFVGFYSLFDLGINSAVTRYVARAIGRSDNAEFNRFFATSFYMLSGLGMLVLAATLLFPLWLQVIPSIWRTLRASGYPYPVLGLVIAGVFGIVEVAARLMPRRLRVGLRIGSVVPIAVFLLALFLFMKTNRTDRQLLSALVLILGANVAVQLPGRSFAGIIDSHLRYDINSAVQIIESLIRLPLLWYVFRLGYGLLALALVSALLEMGAALTRAALAFRLQRGLRFLPRDFDLPSARIMFEYGANSLVSRIADTLRFRATPFLITLIRSVTLMTPFAIAGRLNQVVGDIMMSLMSVLDAGIQPSGRTGGRPRHARDVSVHLPHRDLRGSHSGRPYDIARRGVHPPVAWRAVFACRPGDAHPGFRDNLLLGADADGGFSFWDLAQPVLRDNEHDPWGAHCGAGLDPHRAVRARGRGFGRDDSDGVHQVLHPADLRLPEPLEITPMEFYLRHAAPNFLVPMAYLACVSALARPFVIPQYGNLLAIAVISCVLFCAIRFVCRFRRVAAPRAPAIDSPGAGRHSGVGGRRLRMDEHLDLIVLAAGKGARMKNATPQAVPAHLRRARPHSHALRVRDAPPSSAQRSSPTRPGAATG